LPKKFGADCNSKFGGTFPKAAQNESSAQFSLSARFSKKRFVHTDKNTVQWEKSSANFHKLGGTKLTKIGYNSENGD
jgi:hypothetical protein